MLDYVTYLEKQTCCLFFAIVNRYYHMAVKMKSVSTGLKAETPKKNKPKNHTAAVAEILYFRRKTDFGGSLLNVRRKMEQEISTLNKKFYRRKTDIERCKDLDDNELIMVIQTQNHQAYFDLFRRYQKKLFIYIYRLTRDRSETEDILQNVFTKTYKNIQNFDLSRKFSSWIYRIAHNEAINHLKRKSKRYTVSWDDVTISKDKLDMASEEIPMEELWLQDEVIQNIGIALKKMPKQYRQILEMRYFKEYSYEQISKILDKPVNTVGTIINRAKKKLLVIMKEEENGK